MDYSRFDYTV